jgi:ClpP class serine protease
MRYSTQGLLAIAPTAIGAEYERAAPTSPAALEGVAIVAIRGPLDSSPGGWCDDYQSIVGRVALACQAPVTHVVLDFDSPGGAVSGLFEACDEIRALCADAGKVLVAYVSGQCCSAAYALACAASRIVTCSTGVVGSIGVIDCRVDVSAANEAGGVRYSLVSSGSRKADGHPCVAVTDVELAARQRVVDDLAGVFFAAVDGVRGISSRSLEAAVYVGESARTTMLVDDVLGYRAFLAALSVPEVGMTFDEIMAALAEMAKGEGEDAERAKAALALLSGEGKSAPEETAMVEVKPAEEASTVAQLAAQVQALSARVRELDSVREDVARSAVLSSRPDLSPELLTVLAGKPLAEVREIVDALPKRAKFGAARPAKPTLGEGQATATVSSPEFDRVDALMGIGAGKSTGVTRTEHSLVLGSAKKGA